MAGQLGEAADSGEIGDELRMGGVTSLDVEGVGTFWERSGKPCLVRSEEQGMGTAVLMSSII